MELKRSLGLFDAFTIGLGAIIGAGIFVVAGVAAGLAGPSLLLSLLIAFLVSAFTAVSFVHLASFIPREGGGYEYAHEMISPFGGFISGWMWLLSNVVTGAAVAIGFGSYLAVLIPLPVNLIAALACVGITAINYWGISESARLNNILVVFKLFVLFLF
ncbi:MAG: amino acid permease, partial [Methanomassiliicoccales archaeon]|nr:amino acid permease [Methanomassiliicoccales archaeon]